MSSERFQAPMGLPGGDWKCFSLEKWAWRSHAAEGMGEERTRREGGGAGFSGEMVETMQELGQNMWGCFCRSVRV